VSASLLLVASEARWFAIVSGAVCVRLCDGTSMIYDKTFGSCLLQSAMLRTRAIASWKMNGCVSRGALLSCSDALAASFYNSRLSMHAVAVPLFAMRTWFGLPIYADVLGIFSGSRRDTRYRPRKLAGIKTPRAMSPLGRIWI
jgi:hypothetical protein